MKIKEKGQVFTPKELAKRIVLETGVDLNKIKDFKWLEPSFGKGVFFEVLLELGADPKKIYGVEIEEEFYNYVLEKFPEIPKENLFLGSTFDYDKELKNSFDFVVGNPPYIRIHNLDKETKDYIQNNFNFCKKGMTDIYMAFFEIGLSFLNEKGTLSFITPNNYIKSLNGKFMRDYIENNNLLKKFIDFKDKKQFENINTYTAITVLSYNKTDNLKEYPWLNKDREKIGLNFDTVQNGIATLRDRIFIKESFDDIEEGILRDIYKASNGTFLKCIFPYDDNNEPLEEDFIKKNYPKAYKYLLDNKEELLKRTTSKGIPWYCFGRSQGLRNMNNDKIAFSPLVSSHGLKKQILDKETLVYSGMYFTSNNINELNKELESEEFLDFLLLNGSTKNSGYVSIGTTLIKEY